MDAAFFNALNCLLTFSAIEREFGGFLCRIAEKDEPGLRVLGALLLRQINAGHSCLDLEIWLNNTRQTLQQANTANRLLQELGDQAKVFQAAVQRLSASELAAAVCHLADDYPALFSADPERKSVLVWQDGGRRLYLHKYFKYEQDIAAWIKDSLKGLNEWDPYSLEEIRAAHEYFRNSQDTPDYQQLAAQLALKQRFAIITGGPGTGKTTVLAVILGLLLQRQPDCRIALAAPTGKAKARMQEAISSGVPLLHLPEPVKMRLLELQARTVDSLLGHSPEAARPYYHREHPLQVDYVVIDEASMLSLPAMAMLIYALKPDTGLLLLGDRNQLSSVEIGSVFADICNCSKLQSAIATLQKNRRTENNAALIAVAEQMVSPSFDQQRLVEQLYSLQATPEQPEAEFQVRKLPPREKLAESLQSLLQDWGLSNWAEKTGPAEFFQLANSFKILAGNREGEYGVLHLNRLIAELLEIPNYADGTPLMILENDRATGLNNGDIGIVIDRTVFFQNPEKTSDSDAPDYLVFSLAALPPHEPVYAMTIHKSQGSGYSKVLLVLPESDNLVLSRELVYTGLTRTELKFRMWANPEILKAALQRPTQRVSGLTQALSR
ncbi:MAG: exodeoxyribonuclease V subunit alpha [Lentisphaeria bacterium]